MSRHEKVRLLLSAPPRVLTELLQSEGAAAHHRHPDVEEGPAHGLDGRRQDQVLPGLHRNRN